MKKFNLAQILTMVTLLTVGGWFMMETYADARRGGSSRSSNRSSSWGSSKKSTSSKSWGSKKKATTSSKKSYGTTKKKSAAQIKKDKAVLKRQRAAKAKSTANSRRTLMTKKKAANNKARVNSTKSKVANTSKKDWDSKRSSYMSGKTTRTPTYNSSSRYSGNQKTIVINRYNNSYGGYYYADPYNHGIIWGFSSLWWYHHWAHVDRSHYGNDARMRELEREVAALKAEGTAVNSNYVDEGMDETVMYGDGYLNGVKNGTINNKAEAPVVVQKKGISVWQIFTIFFVSFCMFFVILYIVRMNKRK